MLALSTMSTKLSTGSKYNFFHIKVGIFLFLFLVAAVPEKGIAFYESAINANFCNVMLDDTHVFLQKWADCTGESGVGVGNVYINSYKATYGSETGEIFDWYGGITGMNSGNASFDLETNNHGDGIYWVGTDLYTGVGPFFEFDPKRFIYIQFKRENGVWTIYPVGSINSTTHFISLEPGGGEVVTPDYGFLWGAEFWANSTVLDDSLFLRIKYKRNQDDQLAVTNTDLLWTTFDFPLVGGDIDWNIVEGYNHFATSSLISTARSGQYTFRAELRKSGFLSTIGDWFGLGEFLNSGLIVSSSTQFIVGQRTLYDNIIASSTNGFNELLASTTITSIQQVKDFCNPLSDFDILSCLSGLFIPSSQDIANDIDTIKQNVLTRAPIGYFTRMATIFSGSGATSTVPSLSFRVGGALAGLSTTTINFDSALTQAGGIVETISDPITGSTVRSTAENPIRLLVALSVLMTIFYDILGSSHRKFVGKKSVSR